MILTLRSMCLLSQCSTLDKNLEISRIYNIVYKVQYDFDYL